MSSTQDVRFSEGMLDEGAKLANKLWNAARFVLLQADPAVEPAPLAATAEDSWILSRLVGTGEERGWPQLEAYDFSAAVKALYAFVWNDFCDWYVEAAKPRLYGEDATARSQVSSTLLWVLERLVALAHPILPFVTEEIWGIPAGAARPAVDRRRCRRRDAGHRDPALERAAPQLTWRWSVRRGGWPTRGSGRWRRLPQASLFRDLLDRVKGVPGARLTIRWRRPAWPRAPTARRSIGELADARAELQRAQAKLANQRFVSGAPEQVVAAERDKAERYAAEVAELERRLSEQ